MQTYKNSTVVRSQALPKIWDGLALAAPGIAEPLLRELFLTPVRRGVRSEPSGTVLGQVESRGRHVKVRSWGQGPVVVLVHGWQGHLGQFDAMRESLVAAGYCVVCFDMPAHGESSGRTTSIVEFSEVLGRVVDLVEPVHSVVAHSLGGTALSLALRRGLDVGGAVIIAPMISFDFALNEFAKVLHLGPRARELTARATEQKVGIHRSELDLRKFGRPDAPVMLIHDRDDRRTRHSDSRLLAERWACPLVETEGYGHSRILREPSVISEVRGFIDAMDRPNAYDLKSHLGPIGSFEI